MFVKPITAEEAARPFEILDGGHVESFLLYVLRDGESPMLVDMNGFTVQEEGLNLGTLLRNAALGHFETADPECIFAYDVSGYDRRDLDHVSGYHGMTLFYVEYDAPQYDVDKMSAVVVAIPDRHEAMQWKLGVHGVERKFDRPDHWPKLGAS